MNNLINYPDLEICVATPESLIIAADAGAERAELCSALPLGGLSPSPGLMRLASTLNIRTRVLIRPREGDFIYSARETESMKHDIQFVRNLGLEGVVIGALTPEGDIDLNVCSELMKAADGMKVTFHRAFDLCRDPFKALEEIISLGCDTLLTSGHASSAEAGITEIRQLCIQSQERISIMAGSGINSSNAARIKQETGCHTLHASAKNKKETAMLGLIKEVSMGGNNPEEEYSWMEANASEIKNIINQLRSLRNDNA